jgi:hypothetical protein
VGKQLAHHCKIKVEGINIGRSMAEERRAIDTGIDVLVSTYPRINPLIAKG